MGAFGVNNWRFWETKEETHQNRVNKGKSQTSDQRSILPEWLQQYASMGTDKDGNISSKAIGNGAGYSNTQLMDMQYNHDEAQIDRDWNEQMYLKYQSPDAMMRQYQEAGLNPALMYEGGVDINGPSGGSSASTSSSQAGEGPQAGFERVMGVMSTLMQLMTGSGNIASTVQGIQSQRVQNENQTSKTNADVGLIEEQTKGVREDNARKSIENEIYRATKAQQISKIQADSFLAEWEADVRAGVDPSEASDNLRIKYGLDKAMLDKTNSEKAKVDAEKSAIEAKNLREAKKLSHELDLIDAQISKLNSETDFLKVQKDVEESVKKSADVKAYYDEYARINKLPLGDYTAIALYDSYAQAYKSTKNEAYLTMMQEVRNMMFKNYGKDVKVNWKDGLQAITSLTGTAVKAVAM